MTAALGYLQFQAYNSEYFVPISCLQGRIEEADQLYVRALEINEMSVGPDHRGVGTIFHNRAAVLEKQV